MMSTLENKTNINLEGEKITSSVGMVVALVSFAMLFATLMMGFALYRFSSPVWPPAGMIRPSLFLPSLSTLIIFMSSLCFIHFEKDIKNQNGLNATIILGIAFMIVQSIFWKSLALKGIYASSGIFPSIVYSFTWIHAAHIVLALGLLIWLKIKMKKPGLVTIVKVNSVGKFWHFLGIVWFVMFMTIFVL